MTRVLAVGSPKGGVGKTTESVHLATIAAKDYGLDVLLVDADPNHSALDWADRGSAEAMPFAIAEATGTEAEHLADLRKSSGYDLVVVDLPGAREGAFRTMLSGTGGKPVPDLLVVPVQPKGLDLRPVIRVVDNEIAAIGLDYFVVFTIVDPRSFHIAQERRQELLDREPSINVAETIIRDYAVYDDAHESDRTVLDLKGARSYARVAEDDQRALAREVFTRLGFQAR